MSSSELPGLLEDLAAAVADGNPSAVRESLAAAGAELDRIEDSEAALLNRAGSTLARTTPGSDDHADLRELLRSGASIGVLRGGVLVLAGLYVEATDRDGATSGRTATDGGGPSDPELQQLAATLAERERTLRERADAAEGVMENADLRPNLVVDSVGFPDAPVSRGSSVEIRLRIENAGDETASDVVVTASTDLDVSPDARTLGALEPGEETEVEFGLAATRAGTTAVDLDLEAVDAAGESRRIYVTVEDSAGSEPRTPGTSRATFEFYEDAAGEFRWRLRHDNGEILADSGEGYASRSGARAAVDRIEEYAGEAEYLQPDPTAVEVYRDRAGEWRWRLVHRNGNVLADSGQGYASRHGAHRAFERIGESVGGMEFEVYEDAAGGWRWRLRARNNRIVADSGEGYASRDGASDAADGVREYVPTADSLDVEPAAFEVYEDAAGEWRWRLVHRNGNVLADSGEGYVDAGGARTGIDSVRRNVRGAGRREL